MHKRSLTRALAPLVAVGLIATATVARADGPARPDRDAFYTYSGTRPLADIAPGSVLKSRATTMHFGTGSTPVNAEQLLYRTTGQRGQPTVTVTTVLAPVNAPVTPNIVGYLSFYDGLDSKCDPSYTLAGGDAGGAAQQEAEEEELLIKWYLSQGFVVTVPDVEGTDLEWMDGRVAGFASLDGIRATESYLHAHAKVGLSGYSGGALAADWASELAPAYAPKLDIVGVAMGGVPVNEFHLFEYANGTSEYAAAIPAMLLGLSRAYGVNLAKYLSSYGAKVVHAESTGCMPDLFGRWPGLTLAKILKPAYRDWQHVPALALMLRGQTMGTAPGHPSTHAPIYMGVGNSDGKGDGVMRAGDVQALANEYCLQGVPVQFEEYQGASHQTAGAFFEPKTGPFLQERFAGAPFKDNCPLHVQHSADR
jgi:Secretory lipase